jgi:hypothetical protein
MKRRKKHKILRSALLPENAKVGLSNSRVDAEGEVYVALQEYPEAPAECNNRWEVNGF